MSLVKHAGLQNVDVGNKENRERNSQTKLYYKLLFFAFSWAEQYYYWVYGEARCHG